ncbi:MAG TPA: hypothetical protein VN844_14025 [Pyrinomonadaceae bacterium]|nr:hypothetical protein [Pyrinomonadaceae bacterium]
MSEREQLILKFASIVPTVAVSVYVFVDLGFWDYWIDKLRNLD